LQGCGAEAEAKAAEEEEEKEEDKKKEEEEEREQEERSIMAAATGGVVSLNTNGRAGWWRSDHEISNKLQYPKNGFKEDLRLSVNSNIYYYCAEVPFKSNYRANFFANLGIFPDVFPPSN